jgi:pyruvate dehydrogenase E1 component alpha subunit
MAETKRSEKEFLFESLHKMLLIRRVEERTAQLYQQGKFGGFCHLYNGQEAVVVGAEAALRKDDYIMTAYRDHAHALLRGVSPEAAIAELLGKETGCTGGKGGSMHFFNAEENFMGGWGIVGGHVPLAAGLAFSAKYRGEDRISMVFLGDGAVPQGVVYESFNMASLWDLPLLVVIENNGYAMGTPLERSNANQAGIHRRAEPFGIDCHRFEGHEVQEIHAFFQERVEEVRTQSRPQLVEIMTYRFRGHSMSDPIHGHYRSKDEVEGKKQVDPILLCRKRLENDFGVSPEEIRELDKQIVKEVRQASAAAELASPPHPDALHADVYAS